MNALDIKDLNKSFKDFKLDNLNLTLPCGCIMGLIGENGAGKSTTIRLILDILKKDSGTITILGRDNEDNIQLTKEDVGVVMDEAGIPECMTAVQVGNIMSYTFKNWDSGEYAELLKRFDLPADKPFKDFSRGMKMKMSIAIAMSHHAKLLLLDEPTSGLDPVVRDEVVELFFDFTRDEEHSILISSHIVSDLEKLCDYIAFLHKGKLMLCEEKDVLLRRVEVGDARHRMLRRGRLRDPPLPLLERNLQIRRPKLLNVGNRHLEGNRPRIVARRVDRLRFARSRRGNPERNRCRKNGGNHQ